MYLSLFSSTPFFYILSNALLLQGTFYDEIAKPTIVPAFVAAIEGAHGGYSITPADRLFRSHGQCDSETAAPPLSLRTCNSNTVARACDLRAVCVT